MRGALQSRGIPITEVPEPAGCTLCGEVPELNDKVEGRFREVGVRSRAGRGDGRAGGIRAAGTGDGEADVVGAGSGVGMHGVLHGRNVAITEVPQPGGRRIGALVGEGIAQLIAGFGEGSLGNGTDDGHCRATGIGPAGIGGGEANGIGAGLGIGMIGVLLGRGIPVSKVPEP